MAENLLRAFINADVSIESITSMWTARVEKQVNRTAQHFACALLRVCRYATNQWPKTSTPTLVNGAFGEVRSTGRSDIFC